MKCIALPWQIIPWAYSGSYVWKRKVIGSNINYCCWLLETEHGTLYSANNSNEKSTAPDLIKGTVSSKQEAMKIIDEFLVKSGWRLISEDKLKILI